MTPAATLPVAVFLLVVLLTNPSPLADRWTGGGRASDTTFALPTVAAAVGTNSSVFPGSSLAENLTLGAPLGPLPSAFWGVNYNYAYPDWNNRTIAGFLNETPITWIRLPLGNTAYNNTETWRQLATFCGWVHCHSIATVGGPNTTPQQGVADVERAVALGIHPDYWVFGNEPDLWPMSGLAYAELVQQWIVGVLAVAPTAKFLGAEVSGNPKVGDPYIYNVTLLDGPYLSGIGIQLYPQDGGDTPAQFLNSINSNTSVASGIKNAQALMSEACPTCTIPIFLGEFNGGSGLNTRYIPFRESELNAVVFAASIVQGLRVGLQQFAPWTLTALADDKCDLGLIELQPSCDGRTLNPDFYLYSGLLDHLPMGNLTNASVPGLPFVYALADTLGAQNALLLVNTNVTVDADIQSNLSSGRCVTTYLEDPAHPGPVETEKWFVPSANVSDPEPAAFDLPAEGILVADYASVPGPCPVGPTGPFGPYAVAVIVGVALVVGVGAALTAWLVPGRRRVH
ncbi:MAG: hypothetical protein WCB19_00405 [Thermoplasmata archaeon]